MIWSQLNVSSFLDLCSHYGQIPRSSFSSKKGSSYLPTSTTAFILAAFDPIVEEHKKLIDHLSEPSSQLIYHIAHLSKEETLTKNKHSCFILGVQVMVSLPVIIFLKKALPLTISAEYPSKKVIPLNHQSGFTLSPADYTLVYYSDLMITRCLRCQVLACTCKPAWWGSHCLKPLQTPDFQLSSAVH